MGKFSENLSKKGLNVSEKMAKHVLKNPRQALDIEANIATAAASRNLEAALSTLPEFKNFNKSGKGLDLGNFFLFIPTKWNRKDKIYPFAPLENEKK